MSEEAFFVVCSLPIDEEERLELRRFSGGGAAWFLVEEEGEARAITVPAVIELAPGLWWEVMQATQGELEYQDPAGTWTGRDKTPHPSPDPLVQRLCAEWREAWRRFDEAKRSNPPEEIPAFALRLVLDEAGDGDGSVHVRVVAHGGACDHAETVCAVLEHLATRDESSVAVIDCGKGYVQAMDKKDFATLYLEAYDPGYRGEEPLSPDQRQRLEALGWTDPKEAPIPYGDAQYPWEWTGGNFAREWPRDSEPARLAQMLVETLAVYGLEPGQALDVDVFRSVV